MPNTAVITLTMNLETFQVFVEYKLPTENGETPGDNKMASGFLGIKVLTAEIMRDSDCSSAAVWQTVEKELIDAGGMSFE